MDELKKTIPQEKLEAFFESELRQRYGISTADLNERYGSSAQNENTIEETILPFPTLHIRSWDALRKHAAEMLIYAAPTRYEYKIRSMRVSNRPREARAYLSNMYRYEGSNRFKFACQLCHESCATFENTEIFLNPETELDPVNLCLCPNCAADVESLHSFNTMLNRTRRKDIQDFCVRRSFTVETSFTAQQYELHNELLRFEFEALSKLHSIRSIPFMMSTIRRQAASCIFGLAPHIRDLISRRFNQMVEDPDVDLDEYDLDSNATSALMMLAQRVLELADQLPEDDPKFDSILKIIHEKQKQENNKIILFSSFRHTLSYLEKKLLQQQLRVAQINGSIKDDARRELRERFELDKSDPDALDMLLFTEVGSEGLDYQFCDTMINYDLPWNPMRIEQRIYLCHSGAERHRTSDIRYRSGRLPADYRGTSR